MLLCFHLWNIWMRQDEFSTGELVLKTYTVVLQYPYLNEWQVWKDILDIHSSTCFNFHVMTRYDTLTFVWIEHNTAPVVMIRNVSQCNSKKMMHMSDMLTDNTSIRKRVPRWINGLPICGKRVVPLDVGIKAVLVVVSCCVFSSGVDLLLTKQVQSAMQQYGIQSPFIFQQSSKCSNAVSVVWSWWQVHRSIDSNSSDAILDPLVWGLARSGSYCNTGILKHHE